MKLNTDSNDNTAQQEETVVDPFLEYNKFLEIDSDLVNKVVQLIPVHTWNIVLAGTVAQLIELMKQETLIKLASFHLTEYYLDNPQEIIPDLMRFLGETEALEFLDSLELDKIEVPQSGSEEI
jgi:hypothetical protein